MAKEMMIVFVYDTLRCLAEADDPAEAVLYFHPGWVSDGQRMSLCGQLMGVCHCLKALFSAPRVLTLHSGKFLIREYGRYVLAVGSDRNIPDWMLKNRAEKLTSLIKVYHCDLQTLAAQFPGENNPRFSEKLYQMFETYLPVLQYGSYMFQTVPLLNLPKSATNIFLESMQVLDHCRRTEGVLGGTILYNNKIVATQLNSKLTSHLSMVDPYRIKSPAESVLVDYELPQGVQLLVVYIRKQYYQTLKNDAEKVRAWYENGFEKVKSNKNVPKQIKEPTMGGMKRDKSLLFTAVPEEEIHTGSPSPSSPAGTSQSALKENITNPLNMPDVVPFTSKPRPRPNKLMLSFKNSVSRDSIDEDNAVAPVPSGPVFTGQTSVCSTPMLEFKRLHGNVMSICRNSDDQLLAEALNVSVNPIQTEETESDNQPKNSITQQDILTEEKTRKISKEFNPTGENIVSKPVVNIRKFKSLGDINNGLKCISHFAMMRFSKIGSPNKNLSLNSDEMAPEEVQAMNRINFTITDPYYPVFRSDGTPISKSLFKDYLSQNFAELSRENENEKKNTDQLDTASGYEHFEGFDSIVKASPVRRKSHDVKTISESKGDWELPPKPDKLRRKSLCLPLKSLGSEKENSSLFDPQNRKKLAGVQLTPLMEKLSHLAFSEKSSGYSSRGVTPMEFKDFALGTPCIEKTVVFPEDTKQKIDKPEALDSESDSDDDSHSSSFSIDSVRSVLYVYGLQNISIILLIDEQTARNSDAIDTLWQASTLGLAPIEQMCMEPLPGCEESSEAYSYLSLDPQWGPVKKGGPWASGDIATMGYIHKDFQEDSSLTEIIIRNEESLVLGTSCGGAEVYYQEAGGKQPGLPTPADLMGTAPLKAKRRLQRDHTITIF